MATNTSNKANLILMLHLFQSFLSTWALMKASRMEPGNILTFVFFLLLFFFYRHVNRRVDSLQGVPVPEGTLKSRVTLALSVLFTLFYTLVDYPYYIERLTSRLYRFLILALVFSGFVILFYYLLAFLFSYTCSKT